MRARIPSALESRDVRYDARRYATQFLLKISGGNLCVRQFIFSRPRTSLCTFAVAFGLFMVSGCGLIDSGIAWRDGSYALLWIDAPEKVALSYDMGGGNFSERVAPQVFAVGSDARYVVAKQHPNGDKTITQFFIVARGKDSSSADATSVVIGPLSAAEFAQESAKLKLPAFSKTLESLQ